MCIVWVQLKENEMDVFVATHKDISYLPFTFTMTLLPTLISVSLLEYLCLSPNIYLQKYNGPVNVITQILIAFHTIYIHKRHSIFSKHLSSYTMLAYD